MKHTNKKLIMGNLFTTLKFEYNNNLSASLTFTK